MRVDDLTERSGSRRVREPLALVDLDLVSGLGPVTLVPLLAPEDPHTVSFRVHLAASHKHSKRDDGRMPEMPQMEALAERLEATVGDRRLSGIDPLGFSGLKTVDPAPDSIIGRALARVGRRAKYLVLDFDGPR